jgi:hypothetical protein
MPIVTKNHPLTVEEIQVIVGGLRKSLDAYETKRAIDPNTRPAAREEDLWLLRLFFNKLLGGKTPIKELVKIVSALPVTVGSVPTVKEALGGYLGLYYTAHKGVDVDTGEVVHVPITLCRKTPKSEWSVWDEVFEQLDDDPASHGYVIEKTDGAGFINCPGWSETEVTRRGDDVVKVVVTKHHACSSIRMAGTVKKPLFASEAWHAWRCPECKGAMDIFSRKAKSRGISINRAIRVSILRKKIKLSD